MKVFILVGTRPNFIKITQFKKVASQKFPKIAVSIIHTGQHYDEKMADVFFRQFNLMPDYFLNILPDTADHQIEEIIFKLEKLIETTGSPDLFMVPGDVNSTRAGAEFAKKNKLKLAHIEAGLRSFDESMPEEHNRIITDKLSDLFFVTEPSGEKHLLAEGFEKSKIHFVGNTMIDTMIAYDKEIEQSTILNQLKISEIPFVLMTMHRPATVDHEEEFKKLIELIKFVTIKYKIIFPIHPRTIKNAKQFNLEKEFEENKNLICTEPLDYFSFQKLIKYCRFILTDSGGIQEESTYRKKPCLTLRPNTERPVTVEAGTNTLLPFNLEQLKEQILLIENGNYKKGQIPDMWDGGATERILKIVFNSNNG